MIRIVHVKIAGAKAEEFDAEALSLEAGESVIVNTEKGLALGKALSPPYDRERRLLLKTPRKVARKATPEDIEQFAELLDSTLKSINSDYEAKRFKDINLIKPVIRSVPNGTFHRWLKSKNKLGGQNKVPRLSNTREYIEELYAFAGLKT